MFWRGSVLVANAIAFICEAADHHADLTVTWPRVGVALSTHSAGGITARDIEVASLIERAGQPVAVVMGSPRNIKITTPADMELAEFYLKASR